MHLWTTRNEENITNIYNHKYLSIKWKKTEKISIKEKKKRLQSIGIEHEMRISLKQWLMSDRYILFCFASPLFSSLSFLFETNPWQIYTPNNIWTPAKNNNTVISTFCSAHMSRLFFFLMSGDSVENCRKKMYVNLA